MSVAFVEASKMQEKALKDALAKVQAVLK
jgi:hypothetical protein